MPRREATLPLLAAAAAALMPLFYVLCLSPPSVEGEPLFGALLLSSLLRGNSTSLLSLLLARKLNAINSLLNLLNNTSSG